jgi:CubicO group peptidase (beta-lactamase class C family)
MTDATKGSPVTRLVDVERELKEIIDECRKEDHVPGVTLAVGVGDEVIECAAGVLNLSTGVEATTDSLFQIGSITKTFTATLVMQLVDEGLVELDKPVRGYVPEFSLTDLEAAGSVTVRQLLCHTGGFDGDVFDDFGRGDDAVSRYVEALKDREQNFPPGQRFSYCNSGYIVLGRLVERVRHLPSWDAALRTHLIKPLGLAHTVSLAEEAIMFRTAVGHVDGEGGNTAEQRLAPAWQLPRATAPAGATLCASARDLVAWAMFHVSGGLAPDGTRLLGSASAAAMRETQTPLPPFDDDDPHHSWGLGWQLTEFENGRIFGHSGSTIGQAAMLEIAPELAVTYALLTNGGAPTRMFHAIRTRVFGALAGIDVPPRPTPPSLSIELDPDRFIGRYQNAGSYYVVKQSVDGGLETEIGSRGALREQLQQEPKTFRMTGFSPSALITGEPENGAHWRLAFPETGTDGRATAVFTGSRLARRVDDAQG